DHHRRGLTGNGLADAITEERQHLELNAGETFEDRPDLLLHRLLFLGGDRLEVDVELAAMWAPRVFAQLGATHLLLDGGDVLVREKRLGNVPADTERFLERRPRRGKHLQHKVAFAERGQERLAEERHRRDARHADYQ